MLTIEKYLYFMKINKIVNILDSKRSDECILDTLCIFYNGSIFFVSSDFGAEKML